MLTIHDVESLLAKKNTYRTAAAALSRCVDSTWPLSYRLWLSVVLIRAAAERTARYYTFSETAEYRRWASAEKRWVRRVAFQRAQSAMENASLRK